MDLGLTDNVEEKQREIERQRAVELEQQKKAEAQAAILAADLKAWEIKKEELSRQFEENYRAEKEQQLYRLKIASANGPQLTPSGFKPSPILGHGYGYEGVMRKVSAEVDLWKTNWLNHEREEFFRERKDERDGQEDLLKSYADNRQKPPPRNYDELKTQQADLSFVRDDRIAEIAVDILDTLGPAPRKVTADEYLASQESRREYLRQQAAERERNNTLDKIIHDRQAGNNQNPENMRDDLKKLNRDDLGTIKRYGEDGIKQLMEERERELQRERERNQGRTRER